MKNPAARGGPYISVALAVAYCAIAHLAISIRHASLIATSVMLLCAIALSGPLLRGRPWAVLLLAACAAALWWLDDLAVATPLLFLPPVLITGMVAWQFAGSLREGSVPLIERFARTMEGHELPDDRRAYARRLTATWACVTGLLCATNLLLALLAEPNGLLLAAGIDPIVTVQLETWSLFANLVNYLVLGAMFVGEFAYRRWRFPGGQPANFIDFVRSLVRLGPALVRRPPDP